MTNDELRKEWMRKLPHVEPTDRELSAFALGVEAGVALATPKSHADRWNIDVDDSDGSLLICKGDHEKHEPCVCERYVPAAQQGQDTIAITPRLQTGQQEYLVPVPVDPAAPGPGRHWWPVSKGHADNVCAAAPQQADTCPTCGSECNERDELTKAEREIERLRAEVQRLREALEYLIEKCGDSDDFGRSERNCDEQAR